MAQTHNDHTFWIDEEGQRHEGQNPEELDRLPKTPDQGSPCNCKKEVGLKTWKHKHLRGRNSWDPEFSGRNGNHYPTPKTRGRGPR